MDDEALIDFEIRKIALQCAATQRGPMLVGLVHAFEHYLRTGELEEEDLHPASLQRRAGLRSGQPGGPSAEPAN